MIFKKAFLGTYNFIKRIYLWLFNFMVNGQKGKFNRFYGHMTTIFLLGFCPIAYIVAFVQLLQEGASLENHLFTIVWFTLAPAVIACMVKLMMAITRKD